MWGASTQDHVGWIDLGVNRCHVFVQGLSNVDFVVMKVCAPAFHQFVIIYFL